MNSLRCLFFVCLLCSVILTQADQTVSSAKTSSDCSFDDDCRNAHMTNTVINDKIFCCLNGHLPSVNIVNTKMSCTCDPDKTMTPDELEHSLENTFSELFG